MAYAQENSDQKPLNAKDRNATRDWFGFNYNNRYVYSYTYKL